MTAIAQALSTALLRFVWQGTVVAFLLWIALRMLRNRAANARYVASCAAMALMAALPVTTLYMVYRQPTNLAAAGVAAPAAISMAATGAALQSATFAWITIWRQWALPVWSVGVFLFALRLVLSCRHVAALRRLGRAAEGRIAETVSVMARRMKVSRPIRVLISNVAESPSVVGWLRPAILLPAATLAGLEPEQLQAVLAHEIAHIRRYDYLVNLAQTLVETLLFYHPAVWWASARIRHERELCCDDAAVAVCGDAISYARALTSLERLRAMTPRLALGSTGGSLMYRIERLANVKQNMNRELGPSRLPGIAALALGLACFATTVHWAKAQQMAQQPQLRREAGITVSTTGKLLNRSSVLYPIATIQNGIQGTLLVEATLDQSGNVSDAHVLSGPPELRKTVLQSVLQWQFADAWAGETQQVSITFQAAQAQAQHSPQEALMQSLTTEAFLKNELRAAQERGDSLAAREMQEKTNRAEEAVRLLKESAQLKQDTQLAQLDRALSGLRANLGDENAAQLKQLEVLFEQVAAERAKQERLAKSADTNGTELLPELQYKELEQKLADARRTYSELHPEVVAAMAKLEAMRKQMQAASFVGERLSSIDAHGLSETAMAELHTRLNLQLGEVLSQESIDNAIAAVHSFDPRLECGFERAANGKVGFRIAAPAAGREPIR